ncbi:MAG: Asp-tRNA(Asn)/Glu-tRNA(Gln) amidotransferase subunit GatA [Gammaproteobacteria bacterium]|nr:Asp-tRNA(Asn)/Glu-tRNA(Gln) amidotransferase subunit GatA [Gammaproteobacteria bacterium]
MHDQSLGELRAGLDRKDYSSVELTRHFLGRIHHGQRLNAFISVTEDLALEQARQADERIAGNDSEFLTGIPIAHKDLFCTLGVRTTCGSRILDNFISPYDATVVRKLKSGGMVMLGKTNMDEFAMGSSNENSYYGHVKNPWDEKRVPGGSSGGSAAAVSARLAPVATATDTGGSIRQPAALCGLTGIKPSYGRVSRYGMVAFASSLDQGGVLARSAADAALVLQAMSGFDRRDSTSLDRAVPDYPGCIEASIHGKVIGLPKEFFGQGADPAVMEAVEQAVRIFESMGAKTTGVELPNSEAGIPCYYVLAPAEASSNLARFDGVRYGHRTEQYEDLMDMYERTRAEGFGEEVKRRIMIGTYVLSSGYYDAYYVKAQKLRRMIADDFQRAFEKCDFIAGPTTPGTAFVIGEKSDDPVSMYLNDIFTNSANLAGLPAISVPAGLDHGGLPIGLHLIGRYLDEATILNAAHQFQQRTDWHRKTPEGFE